jgi:hypothetical protein
MGSTILRLRPWDEASGILQRIIEDEPIAILDFSRLQIQISSGEMALIRKQLLQMIGKRISILKTDIIEKPIIMRVIDDE